MESVISKFSMCGIRDHENFVGVQSEFRKCQVEALGGLRSDMGRSYTKD